MTDTGPPQLRRYAGRDAARSMAGEMSARIAAGHLVSRAHAQLVRRRAARTGTTYVSAGLWDIPTADLLKPPMSPLARRGTTGRQHGVTIGPIRSRRWSDVLRGTGPAVYSQRLSGRPV
uniref:Uncharacterized protein n=1 Tax=Streptomyces sp. ML694-90F3 TaxID=1265536 RepID=A0A077KRD3_9ACTN|nr:hypothetical protein [Streptomyces sp. ML694-90F3]